MIEFMAVGRGEYLPAPQKSKADGLRPAPPLPSAHPAPTPLACAWLESEPLCALLGEAQICPLCERPSSPSGVENRDLGEPLRHARGVRGSTEKQRNGLRDEVRPWLRETSARMGCGRESFFAFRSSRCAWVRVLADVLPFGGAGRGTPALRAFDNPIAIACSGDRAPCFPSRM